MTHDVFISYSSLDKTAADTVCSILEQNGISCWIAPRDITPGLDFAEAIIDGIKSSKLFILVYSSHSNNSKQVIREVDRAVHIGLPVINLRIEDVHMSKQLEYYLSSVHWLDAKTAPLEEHINKLSGVVKILLRKDDTRDGDLEKAIRDGILWVGQDKKSIAVLPFKNMSNDPDQEYFSDGMMEEILDRLFKIGDLKVISRTSSMRYKNSDKPIKEIARELGVASIIEGSVRRAGNNVRIAVQLIDAGTDAHLWSEIYNGDLSDLSRIFIIQSEVAQSVARELNSVLSPKELKLIEKIPTKSMEAYDAFLKGKFYVYKATQEDIDTALHYFEQSKEKDPEFALAYVGIGLVWLFRQQLLIASPEDSGPRMMEAIGKALDLDNTLADVHFTMAGVNVFGMFNLEGGESAYRKAIEINPNHAEAHALYSHLLNMLGNTEKAMEHGELAIRLDPYNPTIKVWYSQDLLYARRYEEVIAVSREIFEKNPTMFMALEALYMALYLTGRYEESLKAMKLYYCEVLKDVDHVFDQYEMLGYEGTIKLEAYTLAEQSKSKNIPPIVLFELYCFGGDIERALDFLEQVYEMHDPNILYIGRPTYSALFNEPRFKEICKKITISLPGK